MESHKSVDTRAGGYVALYIPTETETLFKAFNARLTDWGQIVTEQVASFSFIRGGWVQDSQLRWIRMMVPSGPEQAVRTAIKPMRIALKETVLRFARSMRRQPGWTRAWGIRNPRSWLRISRTTPSRAGGKQQFEASRKADRVHLAERKGGVARMQDLSCMLERDTQLLFLDALTAMVS